MSEETPVVVEEVANAAPKPAMTAREKAEARRRRILEKGRDRMNVVSGLALIPPSDDASDVAVTTEAVLASESEAKDSNADVSAPVENEDNKEEGDADAVEVAAPTPTKPSTSARMAQMRRRRYKKAAENAAAKEESKSDAPVAAEDVAVAVEDKSSEQETVRTVVAEPTKETVTSETVAAAGPEVIPSVKTGEKKSYMGVAKMRRKKLAEKKIAEEEAFAKELKDLEAKLPKKVSRKSIPLGPILIQLFTVLFLFIAGFDVGVQNHAIVKQEVPYVHTNLSYVDHGIGIFTLMGDKDANANAGKHDALMNMAGDVQFTNEDEFGDDMNGKSKPAGATSDGKGGNVDPLFGVDFDELTAGTGLFMMVARFAVSIHRMLTYFFFTTPLAFVGSILSGPKRFFSNPPVLFLCTVLIRCIGKYGLGGTIPDLDEVIANAEKKSGEKKDEKPDLASTDFVSMGKNFVTNFMKNNFPKAVMVFSVFKDARTDMFVVLCGFFVGLVLPVELMGASSISDEL